MPYSDGQSLSDLDSGEQKLRRSSSAPADSAFDPVNNPEHYAALSPQPLDVIEAWGLGFHEAQVLKYLARAGKKGGQGKRLEDLKKARVYLNRLIALLERK